MAGALTAIDLSTSQGQAVLTLLERARVSPLPAFYKLLFDYVSGVEGLFSARVEQIFDEGGREGHGVSERLYAEFVEPYERKETIERAVARIAGRLITLDALLGESMRASAAQSVRLAEASGHFGSPHLDPKLLRDWIGRVQVVNNAMRQANAALTDELDAAKTELDETRMEIDRSREGALQDPLTGLFNRGGLDRALDTAVKAYRDEGKPFTCAVVDIDHFKSLNDRYGHPVGDEVLRVVSRGLLAAARTGDVVGRPGGDEFLIVLPGTDLPTASVIADRMRVGIAGADLRAVLGAATLGGITVSVGIAQFRRGESINQVVERADRSLYEAKQQGRNRVVMDLDEAA